MIVPITSTTPVAFAAALPAPAAPGTANAHGRDPLRALLQQVESRHLGAHQAVVRDLAALQGPTPSPAAMLRLQAAVGEFTVRVQLSVRLAEDLSRSLQTLTQRS